MAGMGGKSVPGGFGRAGPGGLGGSDESLEILIEVKTKVETEELEKGKKIIEEYGDAGGKAEAGIGAGKKSIEEYSKSVRGTSWDLMLTARSINMLNHAFLGNNEIISKITGAMYGLAAVMRLYTMLQKYGIIQTQAEVVASGQKVAANTTETASIWGKVSAKAAELAMNPLTWGFLFGGLALAGMASAYVSRMQSMKYGGIVPETGPYLLHKGERVVPEPESNFNVININMNTGPISSNIDIKNMLDAMAKAVLTEKRRRGLVSF